MEVNLSEFKKNIISWYPINENQTVLQIGKNPEIMEELKLKTNHVTVIENFKNQQIASNFDFVIIIGELEKLESEKEIIEILKFAKNAIKENGKILIAMQNKFGMKYWSGQKANNVLAQYQTIEKSTENILSLFKIKEILNFENLKYKFYYPLPDFNFTNVIYTDEFLPENESIDARILTYCEHDEVLSFSEREAFKQIVNEEKSLFPFFSNSFFIEVLKNESSENFEDIKYVSYSISRKNEFRIKTVIGRDFVYKTSHNTENENHIKKILNNINILNSLNLNCLDKFENNMIISKYLHDSMSFDKILIDTYQKEGLESFIEKIKQFKNNILDKLLENKIDINENNEQNENSKFSTVFEKYNVELSEELKSKLHFTKTGIIDLIFQNCLVKENRFYIYDQEWYEENVPIEFILFRALFYFSELKNLEIIDEVYKAFEISEFVKMFEELEEKIQENIIDKDMWCLHANSIKDIGSMDKIVDDYKKRLEDLTTHISDLEGVIKKYQESIEELNNSIKNKDEELVHYADSLRAISNSLSWKITKPLRKVSEKLKGISKGK